MKNTLAHDLALLDRDYAQPSILGGQTVYRRSALDQWRKRDSLKRKPSRLVWLLAALAAVVVGAVIAELK